MTQQSQLWDLLFDGLGAGECLKIVGLEGSMIRASMWEEGLGQLVIA